MAKRTPKKKKEATEDEENLANGDETPVKPKAEKGRGKAVKHQESDDDDSSLPQKKGKGKRKAPMADEEEDEAKEKPQRKSRAKKVKKEEDSDVELDAAVAEEEKPKTKPRGRKVKKEEQDEVVETEEETTVKAESSTATLRTKKVKADGGADAEDAADVEQPKPRKSRAKTVKKELSDDEQLGEVDVEPEVNGEPTVPIKNKKKTKASKKTTTKSDPKALKMEDNETDDADAAPETVKSEPTHDTSANGGIDYSEMPSRVKNKVKVDTGEPVDTDLADTPAADVEGEQKEEGAKPKAKRGRKPATTTTATTTTASSSTTAKAKGQSAAKDTKDTKGTKNPQAAPAVGTRRSARNIK